jgi:UDP-glucose 4-epimerase
MRLLVTGAGGFVGAYLAADLVRAGHDVVGTWHKDTARIPAAPSKNLEFRQIDLVDGSDVTRLMRDAGHFDGIVHTAALIDSGQSPNVLRQSARENVEAQANLLATAQEMKCGRFIFTSTISVYGGGRAPEGGYREEDAAPTTYYGWSKIAGEQMLDIASRDGEPIAVSLRLAGVHGNGRSSGALHVMTQAALNGRPISVAEPESRFRWAFIDDVSHAVQLALAAPISGHHVLNIASADVFSLGDLALRIKQTIGSDSPIESEAAAESRVEVMNLHRAIDLLGFTPTSLDDFLTGYIKSLCSA